MRSMIRNVLVAVSMTAVAASTATVAMAKTKKAEPNCEVGMKKEHLKDKNACEKKKGKWLAAGSETTPAAAAAPSIATPGEESKK